MSPAAPPVALVEISPPSISDSRRAEIDDRSGGVAASGNLEPIGARDAAAPRRCDAVRADPDRAAVVSLSDSLAMLLALARSRLPASIPMLPGGRCIGLAAGRDASIRRASGCSALMPIRPPSPLPKVALEDAAPSSSRSSWSASMSMVPALPAPSNASERIDPRLSLSGPAICTETRRHCPARPSASRSFRHCRW